MTSDKQPKPPSEDLLDRIESAIEDVESLSSAEVVVCFRAQAGNYRDVDLGFGAVWATVALAFHIWSPFHFNPNWVLPNVLLVGFLGYLLSRFFAPVRRLMVSTERLERSVEREARDRFLELGINLTIEHTGLLLLVCRFERRIFLLPDSGLQRDLSPTYWHEIHQQYGIATSDERLLSSILETLEKIKGPLQRHFPRRDDDFNELPNRPVEASP